MSIFKEYQVTTPTISQNYESNQQVLQFPYHISHLHLLTKQYCEHFVQNHFRVHAFFTNNCFRSLFFLLLRKFYVAFVKNSIERANFPQQFPAE